MVSELKQVEEKGGDPHRRDRCLTRAKVRRQARERRSGVSFLRCDGWRTTRTCIRDEYVNPRRKRQRRLDDVYGRLGEGDVLRGDERTRRSVSQLLSSQKDARHSRHQQLQTSVPSSQSRSGSPRSRSSTGRLQSDGGRRLRRC